MIVGEKLRQCFLSRFKQNREIAAVNHLDVQRACLLYKRTKILVQLRSAAGKIQRFCASMFERVDHQINRLRIHHLGALWARSDVAMHAGLVALVAKVHLQRGHRTTTERREGGAMSVEAGENCVH